MTLIARTIFILMLVLGPAGLIAQKAPAAEPADPEISASPSTSLDPAPTTVEDDTETEAGTPAEEAENPSTDRHYQVREKFTRLLQRHPDELWMLLKLDPALLTNDAFMSGYPEVQEFLVQHPEIHKNPRFYLSQFSSPAQDRSVLDGIFELLAVFGGVSLTVVALVWLIRTLIEQKRWKQLARTQSEVHNKILDRFSTSEQLLEYIRTPAGGKFLESAPIPLHVEHPSSGRTSTLATRIVWSVQLGVVTAEAALPSSGTMLWRMQMRRRQEAQAAARRSLLIGQVVTLAAAVVLVFTLLGGTLAGEVVNVIASIRLSLPLLLAVGIWLLAAPIAGWMLIRQK